MLIVGALHPVIVCPVNATRFLNEAMLKSTCIRFNKDSKPFEGIDSVATVDIGVTGSDSCTKPTTFATCAVRALDYPADAKVRPVPFTSRLNTASM